MKSWILAFTVLVALVLTGCGGGTSTTSTPPPATFPISVSVSGLTGTGLILQDNGSDNLPVSGDGTFTFTTPVSSYNVTVSAQPSGQTCTVSNGSGTATAPVTVTATCSATAPPGFTISVAVTGLSGGTLIVEDSPTDQLTFTTNNTQTFATMYASGAAYTVSLVQQPAGQLCSVTSNNSSGNITANLTVTIACAPISGTFTISATVSGLTGGSLQLEDNVGDFLTFTANNTQTFATAYPSGSTYTVNGITQPAGQTCTLGSNSTGIITANVNIAVTCVANGTFSISVAVTGLTGTLVMQDDKSDTLTFTTNNTQMFATSYASGSTYAVSVKTQPSGQTCTLSSNATGTITSNITVTATCTTTVSNFTISVAVTGLTGTLVVQDDKSDTLTFTTNKTLTFATSYPSGSTYTVSVKTQPSGQTCTLSSNATGTITSNITVTATCTTNVSNFTISVAVTGLTGTLVVQDDKSDTLTFTTNKTLTFATSYPSGSTYTVSVETQPSGQTCTLSSNSSGTITSNITVTAACTASGGGITISATVTGLSGTLELQNDKDDTLTFTTNGTQTFASSYTSGATYVVDATTQPSIQTCTPSMESGTITSSITITFNCGAAPRQLGTISGVSTVSCSGSIKNGTCQQMTVACPSVPNVFAYVKTVKPSGTSKGTVTYNTGTDGNGLYESLFTFGSTAVQNVLNGGYTTVEISWGTPFNNNQPGGWAQGPGGVLAAACRYATVTQWIYNNIQNDNSLPMCATANSGGAGALAYALSQYGSDNILSMAEVTSGPPTARLDWGCGCQQAALPVQCGQTATMGTCFGKTDSVFWDPAYNPVNGIPTNNFCSNAATSNGTDLPPGATLDFFFEDSVEARGAEYNFPNTFVNLVFGGQDISSAIPIGQDWFDHITSTSKTGQECIADAPHSIPNVLDGAQQIATDIINFCKLQ